MAGKGDEDVKLGLDDPARTSDRLEFEAPAGAAMPMGSLASSIGSRNLMIIIITMPLVFLVVVLAIIGIFGAPGTSTTTAIETTTPDSVRSLPITALEQPASQGGRVVLPVAASSTALPAGIVLPAGAQIGAISLDGDRLAVRADTDEGTLIIVYDLTQGAVIASVPITSGK
jgi:hypothetical protein